MPGGASLKLPDLPRRRWLLVVAAALVVVVGGVAALLVVVLSGGPNPVRVETPALPPAEQAACQRLVAGLPAQIGNGLHRRTLDPPVSTAAAWGQPAVVLRCGVGVPVGYRPDAMVGDVNGVAWYADEQPDAVIFTAVTRQPRVSLAVPRSYQQAFDLLVDLAGPVNAHTVAVG